MYITGSVDHPKFQAIQAHGEGPDVLQFDELLRVGPGLIIVHLVDHERWQRVTGWSWTGDHLDGACAAQGDGIGISFVDASDEDGAVRRYRRIVSSYCAGCTIVHHADARL